MSRAPVDQSNPEPEEEQDAEEMPRVVITRRRALLFAIFALSVVGFLYFVLPQLAGLSDTWQRLGQGDRWWLGVAFVSEALSFVCYAVLFRTVCARGTAIGTRATYQITLAGLAATRLFSAGGAGGIALTAWALRRAGMAARVVADRMIAFTAVLYAVYMGALVVVGFGLYLGVLNGPGPFAITVVPAVFALLLFAIFLGVTLLPDDVERRIERSARGSGRVARTMAKVATAPAALASGVRLALSMARDRELGLLGAIGWWGFDMGALWACFHAYGADPPPTSVIIMSYFVGMLANALPIPGGIGGVDGGMIGAFVAFDVPFGYATVAVLTYRGFSFWLPTLPGAIAYFQLRRTVAEWRLERPAAGAAAAPV
jgi:uncharacterized protein (TIRG00374 family)